MKCKHCNGTGATNWYVNKAFVTCPYCGGTGEMEVEMTNDEWRKTCSTEEFAEWMAQYCCDVNTNDVKEILKNEWEEWLKQPHTEKE